MDINQFTPGDNTLFITFTIQKSISTEFEDKVKKETQGITFSGVDAHH